MTLVLGIDPGFAKVGYAVVQLEAGGGQLPLEMGVFQTEKSKVKANVLASDDNLRRAREIHQFFRKLVREGPHGPVVAFCTESMSFPRSSSVAAKMAMCWGVVAALSAEFDIPVLQVTPMNLKLKVAGNKKAQKEEVQVALKRMFGPRQLDALCNDVNASDEEHPYDALGAVVACSDSDVLRMARQMAREAS